MLVVVFAWQQQCRGGLRLSHSASTNHAHPVQQQYQHAHCRPAPTIISSHIWQFVPTQANCHCCGGGCNILQVISSSMNALYVAPSLRLISQKAHKRMMMMVVAMPSQIRAGGSETVIPRYAIHGNAHTHALHHTSHTHTQTDNQSPWHIQHTAGGDS
jgi:hypothetical protein